MVYVFLADGFEEIEALSTVDILRRAGIEVKSVSVGDIKVMGAHGISVFSDILICDLKDDVEALILPGGMPGTLNLQNCELLCNIIKQNAQKGVLLAAICAAPIVFGKLSLLEKRKYTCYPGFQDTAFGGVYLEDKCVTDKNGNFALITAKGPGAANEFAFAIINHLKGNDTVSNQLAKDMQI